MEIFVDDDTKLTLHGLQQYYIRLDEAAKNRSAQTPIPSTAALLLSSLSSSSSFLLPPQILPPLISFFLLISFLFFFLGNSMIF